MVKRCCLIAGIDEQRLAIISAVIGVADQLGRGDALAPGLQESNCFHNHRRDYHYSDCNGNLAVFIDISANTHVS